MTPLVINYLNIGRVMDLISIDQRTNTSGCYYKHISF